MDELEAKLRGAVEPLLEPGEELEGVCVASQVGLFKGRMVALGRGSGGGWPQISAAVMKLAAVTLKLRTIDGERLKLTLIRVTGPLGKLGGGETQRHGVEAVARFFESAESYRVSRRRASAGRRRAS